MAPRKPVRHKREPLPPNAKYLYEVFYKGPSDWRYRHIFGYTDDEDHAKAWAAAEVAQYTRVTGVRLGGKWYILASVKAVGITEPGRLSLDGFDPCI